jgi:hypothetical protein
MGAIAISAHAAMTTSKNPAITFFAMLSKSMAGQASTLV